MQCIASPNVNPAFRSVQNAVRQRHTSGRSITERTTVYRKGQSAVKYLTGLDNLDWQYGHCTMHIAIWTWHYGHGTMHIAQWTWHYAHGTMDMALSAWHYGHGSMNMALCILHYGHDTMHMALSAWHYGHSSMNIALGTWHYAHCTMDMALCTWHYGHGTMDNGTISMTLWTWQYEHGTMDMAPCIFRAVASRLCSSAKWGGGGFKGFYKSLSLTMKSVSKMLIILNYVFLQLFVHNRRWDHC